MTTDHYVYLLRCGDGSLYTGYTVDLARRLARHQAGTAARYTRGRGPIELVASWRFASGREARQAEVRLKRLSRQAKERLIAEPVGADGAPSPDRLAVADGAPSPDG